MSTREPGPSKWAGAPRPRDPITGLPKSDKPSLLSVARKHGWTVRRQGQGWRCTNGDRVLWIAESDYDRSLADGHLFEGEQAGIKVRHEGLTAVLFGEVCICDPGYKDRYYDQIPDPGCKVLHPPYHPPPDGMRSYLDEQANVNGMSTHERLRA